MAAVRHIGFGVTSSYCIWNTIVHS